MNKLSQQVLTNLEQQFNVQSQINHVWQGICPIGIEVEVKWRDYFPELWEKYLKNSAYKDLSPIDQQCLTQECSQLEKILLPKLNATVNCGLEKGADKYWEFAFGPATQMNLMVGQVNVLQCANLIPSGSHSLHLTIGGLTGNKDSYYMLLLLETLFSTKDRIKSAFNKDNANISGTWARKGMGGLFVKDKNDLKHGYETAIELRTLELSDQNNIEDIIYLTSFLSDIIYAKKQNNTVLNQSYQEKINIWNNFVNKSAEKLENYGLSDKNWKKPNLSPEYWIQYIDLFEKLSDNVKQIYTEELKVNFTKDYVMQQANNDNNNSNSNKKSSKKM